MDASRRSAHSNAYFTGLGSTKRVVLFDTLVDRMAPDEIEAVLAHELGHHRLGHVPKSLVLSAGLSLLAFALLGWLRDRPWFCEAFGVRPSDAATLLLFFWVGPLFAWPLRPLAALVSRRREYAADAFAARITAPAPLRRALLKLVADNAGNLDPDPLHSAFHDGHPPPLSRLGRLNS
jgi:STE24 endopeptidase